VEAAGIERVEAGHELADWMGFVVDPGSQHVGLRRLASVAGPRPQGAPCVPGRRSLPYPAR